MIHSDVALPGPAGAALVARAPTETDWRKGLPVLVSGSVTLRELRTSDAVSLHQLLATEEVGRFISPPPSTVEGFERFIEWTRRERAAGRFVCFAVVPEGAEGAVGIIQLRQLTPTFDVAEWGFAIGQCYWGTGVFVTAANTVLEFAFTEIGVNRLEARSAVQNGRGNGALLKLGATREAVLRRSFKRGEELLDQVMWSITASDWAVRARPAPTIH